MLGGKAPKVDDDFVIAWMTQDWEENLLPGTANEAGTAGARRRTCSAMLDLGRSHSPAFELNGELVTEAQAALARMKMADRAYALIKSSAYSAGLSDFDIASADRRRCRAGVRDPRRHRPRRRSRYPASTAMSASTISSSSSSAAVAAKLESEHWVMGEAGKQSGVEEQFERLGPELLDIYSRDFIDGLGKGALDNLKLQLGLARTSRTIWCLPRCRPTRPRRCASCWNRSRPRPR